MNVRIRSLNDFLALLKGVKRVRDGQYLVLCPGHYDIKPSLSVQQAEDIQNLPPNPTKALDRRSPAYVAKYGDNCWELNALPPDQLRNRVKEAIENYIDFDQWEADKQKMEAERKQIKELIARLWTR